MPDGASGTNMSKEKKSRTGGRSALVSEAIEAAVMQLLTSHGYGGFEIPEIAEVAGINKTSIYRRWSSKADLVAEVVLSRISSQVMVPDTGSLREDLILLSEMIALQLNNPIFRGLLAAALSKSSQDIIEAKNQFWDARFVISGKIIERAIERGELKSDVSSRFILELICSPIFFRSVILDQQISRDDMTNIVDATLSSFVI